MARVYKLIRLLCLLAGAAGVLASLWALIDPSIMLPTDTLMPPPGPRWRAAFGLVFSLALLGWGAGVLRHRELP